MKKFLANLARNFDFILKENTMKFVAIDEKLIKKISDIKKFMNCPK